MTLKWKSSREQQQYNVLYCDSSREWVPLTWCTNISTNFCHLPIIPMEKLSQFLYPIIIKTETNEDGCNVDDDIVPDVCVVTGPPVLSDFRTTRYEIFVSVLAPETPYIDESTGIPYRLDDRYHGYEYIASLYQLNSTGNVELLISRKGPLQLNEFSFRNVTPSTRYKVDITGVLHGTTGQENTTIFLETEHADKPYIICPDDILVVVQKNVEEAKVFWDNAITWDINNKSLTPDPDRSSGSMFPVGKTKVTYWVEDDVGNENQCSFNVAVHAKDVTLGGQVALIVFAIISTLTLAFVIITAKKYILSSKKWKDINILAPLRKAQTRYMQIVRITRNNTNEFRSTPSEREVFDAPVCSSSSPDNHVYDPLVRSHYSDHANKSSSSSPDNHVYDSLVRSHYSDHENKSSFQSTPSKREIFVAPVSLSSSPGSYSEFRSQSADRGSTYSLQSIPSERGAFDAPISPSSSPGSIAAYSRLGSPDTDNPDRDESTMNRIQIFSYGRNPTRDAIPTFLYAIDD
ncbi:uncharacterized protein [Amphiura filiformis]|uniref:uncharacterized protein n=1 Tax=Amphiura filiformis TaxID=82378 RepID=UPI003B21B7D2